NDLLVKVNQAIADSKRVELERLDRPLTALTYQRELISIKRELEQLQRDLSLAKIQLSALMNLPLGESYTLVIPDRSTNVKSIGISPQLMEQIALENRPEIREVSYEKRINSYEAKAAILSLFPNLDLNFGKNYNSNSFIFENDWLGYGAKISSDLINLFKIPATNREFDARGKVLDARRLTLSMAIMTQVYVSLARYEYSRRELETAADYFTTQGKILDQLISAESLNSVSQQSLIREEMNLMVSEIKYDIAHSELENSYAGIFAALGLDLLPSHAFMMPLETLENIIEKKFSALSLYDEIFEMKIE
ncbi:MAG: outer membrane protein TolC, partial [Gammaproteobacteria bacterium]